MFFKKIEFNENLTNQIDLDLSRAWVDLQALMSQKWYIHSFIRICSCYNGSIDFDYVLLYKFCNLPNIISIVFLFHMLYFFIYLNLITRKSNSFLPFFVLIYQIALREVRTFWPYIIVILVLSQTFAMKLPCLHIITVSTLYW